MIYFDNMSECYTIQLLTFDEKSWGEVSRVSALCELIYWTITWMYSFQLFKRRALSSASSAELTISEWLYATDQLLALPVQGFIPLAMSTGRWKVTFQLNDGLNFYISLYKWSSLIWKMQCYIVPCTVKDWFLSL